MPQIRLAVVLALLASWILAAAEPEKFSPRALQREPAAPMLVSPQVGDVLADAVVTASHHEPGQVPEFANNGNFDDNILHWASKTLPAWIRFDLPEARTVAELRLWFFASGGRTYQYVIEGSADGTAWQALVDKRENKTPATLRAEQWVLPAPAKFKSLRLTLTGASKPEEGVLLLEIDAYARPVTQGLSGSVMDVHRRVIPADLPVVNAPAKWSATAWRGERVSGQFAVWTDGPREGLRAEVSGLPMPAKVRFVKQVRADDTLAGDLLEEGGHTGMAGGSHRVRCVRAAPRCCGSGLSTRAAGRNSGLWPARARSMPSCMSSTTLPLASFVRATSGHGNAMPVPVK